MKKILGVLAIVGIGYMIYVQYDKAKKQKTKIKKDA